MIAMPIGEANARLGELIDRLQPGEEIALTRGNTTVARVIKNGVREQARQLGIGKDGLTIVADEDEHFEHFESRTDIESFFLACNALEVSGVEPDWEQHLVVIEESRRRGRSGGIARQQAMLLDTRL